MAETIPEHHISTLITSPSLDDSNEDYGIFDDSEFPFARGVLNGVKCCSKCGATKTPQWREGPFGPKTLCNACGVKRTRKLRAEQDGTKRRKISSSPSKPTYAKTKQPTYSPQEIQDVYDYDDSYPEAAYYNPPSSAGAGGIRRPTRRAAEEAAVKTARYARTGEWSSHPDAATNADLFAPYPPAYHAMKTPASPSASSDFSLPSSDCPEEVSWTPLAAEAAARNGFSNMPMDCYAAVNLMTMSVRSSDNTEGSPSVAHRHSNANDVATVAAAATPPPLSPQEISDTLAKMDGPRGSKFTSSDLTELYKSVPPAKVMELIRLNQELDSTLNEVHAANSAVAAVAAVLAAKQAAALRGREMAIAATKRLRRFMLELDTQFGVSHKALPRIRTSPKKTSSV